VGQDGSDRPPFVFVVAGEPSGDALGAALIRALRRRVGDRLRVAGVGGERMREEGIESLVPLADLAVIGVAEVLPRAPLILRRVGETVAAIKRMRPDAVVTIDSSGFSWRIAQRLRRAGETLPLIHYVAPMVWAWRAGRARRMARWYDHLMALLPFEPPYFERVGLSCSYVGHPVLDSGADRGDGARFRAAYGIGPNETLITVLPGSRAGEVRRLLAIFGEALAQLEGMIGRFRVVVPTVATVAAAVAEAVRGWPGQPITLRDPLSKYDAFAASRAAVAASGSVALELAMARLPMVVCYRLNPLTEALLDRVLKVRQVNLINLLLERPVVRELLRTECAPGPLAAEAERLVRDDRVRAQHLAGYDEALRRLGAGGPSPALQAADRVLAIIAARRRSAMASPALTIDTLAEEFTMTTTEMAKATTKPAAETEKYRYLHTMIRVRDLDKSLDFYTGQLGMKLLRKRDYPTGKFTLAFVGYGDEADNTVLELTHNWEQAEPYALGSAFGHLALGVPNVYKACERLAEAGVKIPRPAGPMAHGGSVIAFIEDPDGYRIELVQRS
jgi:lipid-A-disaccharide synthase